MIFKSRYKYAKTLYRVGYLFTRHDIPQKDYIEIEIPLDIRNLMGVSDVTRKTLYCDKTLLCEYEMSNLRTKPDLKIISASIKANYAGSKLIIHTALHMSPFNELDLDEIEGSLTLDDEEKEEIIYWFFSEVLQI